MAQEITVCGEAWELVYTYRECDKLTFADAGAARVYRGRCVETGDAVAIKVARKDGGQIFNDRTTWDKLARSGGWNGLPKLLARCYNFGDGSEEALVCELCGPSLGWCIRQRENNKLSVSEVSTVGVEVLRHLQRLHGQGFAHRDISPGNLLLPRQPAADDSPLLYLIDFGLAEKLNINSHSKQDRSGTLRFASSQIGIGPLSAYDDLEGDWQTRPAPTCTVFPTHLGSLYDCVLQCSQTLTCTCSGRARVRLASRV